MNRGGVKFRRGRDEKVGRRRSGWFPFWDSGPPLPLFLRKDVILKGLERACVQGCDSKAVTCLPQWQRIDAKGFEAVGNPTRRGFIGDLRRIRAGTRIVQNTIAWKLSNVNW